MFAVAGLGLIPPTDMPERSTNQSTVGIAGSLPIPQTDGKSICLIVHRYPLKRETADRCYPAGCDLIDGQISHRAIFGGGIMQRLPARPDR